MGIIVKKLLDESSTLTSGFKSQSIGNSYPRSDPEITSKCRNKKQHILLIVDVKLAGWKLVTLRSFLILVNKKNRGTEVCRIKELQHWVVQFSLLRKLRRAIIQGEQVQRRDAAFS